MAQKTTWYYASLYPQASGTLGAAGLFLVGRELDGEVGLEVPVGTVSRRQFSLEPVGSSLHYQNLSETPAVLNRKNCIFHATMLMAGRSYLLRFGGGLMVVGTDWDEVAKLYGSEAEEYFLVEGFEAELGALSGEEVLEECLAGRFHKGMKLTHLSEPTLPLLLEDLVDFGESAPAVPAVERGVGAVTVPPVAPAVRAQTSEEVEAVLGESFRCPYCRTVSAIEDVLSVSVSPGLMGDAVLGAGEQRRFLPSHFTGNGLALDEEGGVCTEVACPRCHMTLPQVLLEMPQIVMSVIGAAGAGKSVFLASSMWQCRQVLMRQFGVSFMDLDPVANRWINAYEEKLFFQEDDQTLQQIEKTDLQASNVSRQVLLDGGSVLLPLPSFFQVRPRGEAAPQSLVVYDSAGEHFRAGADAQGAIVTLNMLNADVLFFMFDPSADPRFRALLNRGGGTAQNYAQRQDVLLAEMAARIRRHMGTHSEARLSKPLIFGVSKADLLQDYLPLTMPLYGQLPDGRGALDLGALRRLSAQTEALIAERAPEVVATTHDIAEQVWFLPVSALGHNPMREGVRPCDIRPLWTELPVVMTLAERGLIPVMGKDEEAEARE